LVCNLLGEQLHKDLVQPTITVRYFILWGKGVNLRAAKAYKQQQQQHQWQQQQQLSIQ
jgi:hypothetical protein